jgi:pimeloyl-ACP methyl ester carboxylesterase
MMVLKYKQADIHYTKSGKGQAVVLLHGFLESSSMWEFLFPEFEKSHTLIGIDLPGHGKSHCLGYIHTMEEMAAAVLAVLDYEKIETATFVGHSMGGYVALAIAENHPKRIEKIILLNSNTVADSKERKENRSRAVKLLKSHREAYISMAIGNLFAEETREKFSEAISLLKQNAMGFPVQGIIAALEGMKVRKNRTSVLKKIQIPKYLIAGKQDPIMSSVELKSLAEKTESVFYEMEGGHMSTIENREGVLTLFKKII